ALAPTPLNYSGFFNYLSQGSLLSSPVSSSVLAPYAPVLANFDPPRAIDRVTVGMPLRFDLSASVTGSYIHLEASLALQSNILSVSYTRSLPFGASLFATAFDALGQGRNVGVFAGLSLPLGNSTSATTSVSASRGRSTLVTDATKSLGIDPGSYGWHIRDA